MQTNSAIDRSTKPEYKGPLDNQRRPAVMFATSFASFGLVSRNAVGSSTAPPVPKQIASPIQVNRHLGSTTDVKNTTSVLAPSVPDAVAAVVSEDTPVTHEHASLNNLFDDNLVAISRNVGPSRTSVRTLRSSLLPYTKNTEARKAHKPKTQDPRYQAVICRKLESANILPPQARVEIDDVGQQKADSAPAMHPGVEAGDTSSIRTPSTSPTSTSRRSIAEVNREFDIEYPKYRQQVDRELDEDDSGEPDGDECDQSRQATPDIDDPDIDEPESGMYRIFANDNEINSIVTP